MAQAPSPVHIARVGRYWRLTCAQWVPAPVDEVFPFFAAPRNLERLTPGFLRFHIRRLPPRPLTTGAVIDYRLRLHGLPLWWRTRIALWTPPCRFVDVQVWGPFRRWHHRHEFVPVGSGTEIHDVVTFDVYCRRLWSTAALRWIDGDLRRIFEYRRTQIAARFGSPDARTDPVEVP